MKSGIFGISAGRASEYRLAEASTDHLRALTLIHVRRLVDALDLVNKIIKETP